MQGKVHEWTASCPLIFNMVSVPAQSNWLVGIVVYSRYRLHLYFSCNGTIEATLWASIMTEDLTLNIDTCLFLFSFLSLVSQIFFHWFVEVNTHKHILYFQDQFPNLHAWQILNPWLNPCCKSKMSCRSVQIAFKSLYWSLAAYKVTLLCSYYNTFPVKGRSSFTHPPLPVSLMAYTPTHRDIRGIIKNASCTEYRRTLGSVCWKPRLQWWMVIIVCGILFSTHTFWSPPLAQRVLCIMTWFASPRRFCFFMHDCGCN